MKAVLHVKPANRLSHLISLAEIELDLMVLNAKENCISDHEIDVELVEELVRNYEHLGEKYTVLCDESGINFHSINSSIVQLHKATSFQESWISGVQNGLEEISVNHCHCCNNDPICGIHG